MQLVTPPHWNGSYAVIGESLECIDPEAFTLKAKQVGGRFAAALYRDFFIPPGAIAHEQYGNPSDALQFPAAALDFNLFTRFKSYLTSDAYKGGKSEPIVIKLKYSPNPWDSVFDGVLWTSFQALGMLLHLVILSLSIHKLVLFIRYKDNGLKLSNPAQMSLTLIIISAILRIGFYIDPLGKHRIFTFPVSRWLSTSHFPFNLSASIIMIVTFAKIVRKADVSPRSFTNLIYDWRRVLYVLVHVTFSFDIMAAASHVVNSPYKLILNEINAVFECLVTLLAASIYLHLGVRLLSLFSKGNRRRPPPPLEDEEGSSGDKEGRDSSRVRDDRMDNRRRRERRMSYLIIINSFLLFVSSASWVVAYYAVQSSIDGMVGSTILIGGSYALGSLFLTLSFHVDKPKTNDRYVNFKSDK